jgi:Tol biopolymer transport system component
MVRHWVVVLLCVAVAALVAASASQADYTYVTERVNLNRLGLQSNGGSWAPSMSADGRYVAWHSWATDLIVGDKDGLYDVYLRDRLLGVNYLISATSAGLLENGQSLYPYISADGMSVAFSSVATNLVPGDTNGVEDVFVRDWMAGVLERVSVATSGEQGNAASNSAVVSGDGRFVAFESDATNLIPGGNPRTGIYVRDRLNQATECVSASTGGMLGSQNSSNPAITPDGRYVAFTPWAGNLVAGDNNNTTDTFLRDRQTGTTERVSVATLTGAQGNGSC